MLVLLGLAGSRLGPKKHNSEGSIPFEDRGLALLEVVATPILIILVFWVSELKAKVTKMMD